MRIPVCARPGYQPKRSGHRVADIPWIFESGCLRRIGNGRDLLTDQPVSKVDLPELGRPHQGDVTAR